MRKSANFTFLRFAVLNLFVFSSFHPMLFVILLFLYNLEMPTLPGVGINNRVHTTRQSDKQPKATKPDVWFVSYWYCDQDDLRTFSKGKKKEKEKESQQLKMIPGKDEFEFEFCLTAY